MIISSISHFRWARTWSQEAVLAAGNHLGFMRALGKTQSKLSDRLQIKMDHLAHESKHIFAASQFMKDELVELYQVPSEKIHVLYPPIDADAFARRGIEEQASLKERFHMDPSKSSFVSFRQVIQKGTGHSAQGICRIGE